MSEAKKSWGESWDRWNTHDTTLVEQEVFGTVLRLAQDPSSEHLGTTVWDSSVVLAKWMEKNVRKGDLARSKVRGKRAIELGAGMGLAGMALAMVGADVVLTDTADVLGLLRINYENNLSPAAVRLARGHQHGTWADSAGSVQVAELDWTKPEQCRTPPIAPPYDYIIAADCVYHETIVEHFHRTVMDLTNEKSTVVVCNELRSHSVQGRFMELFSATHAIKTVPHSKLDDTYQHQNIFVYIMHKKKDKKAKGKDKEKEQGEEEAGEGEAVEGQGRAGAVEGPSAGGGAGEGAGAQGSGKEASNGPVGEGRGGVGEGCDGSGRGEGEAEERRAG